MEAVFVRPIFESRNCVKMTFAVAVRTDYRFVPLT